MQTAKEKDVTDAKQKGSRASTDSTLRGKKGLENLGNTCFMSAVLQCWSHIATLMNLFLSKEYVQHINEENVCGTRGKLANAFSELMKKLWARDGAVSVAPRAFKSVLADFAPQFSGYNQQDAQELLAFLLDGLHEDLNRVKVKPYVEEIDTAGKSDADVAKAQKENYLARNKSPIDDMFLGFVKTTTKCPNCEHASVKFDPYKFLSVPFPPSSETKARIDLSACLRQFIKKEQLDEGVEWDCDGKCKKKVPKAQTFTNIWSAPPILIVHLKRVVHLKRGHPSGKINTPVDYPLEDFDISPFVDGNSKADDYWKVPTTSYDLCGVVCHSGESANGGHYIAYTKHAESGKWHRYDDAKCEQIKAEEVRDPDPDPQKEEATFLAYILIYKRKDVEDVLDEKLPTSVTRQPQQPRTPAIAARTKKKVTESKVEKEMKMPPKESTKAAKKSVKKSGGDALRSKVREKHDERRKQAEDAVSSRKEEKFERRKKKESEKKEKKILEKAAKKKEQRREVADDAGVDARSEKKYSEHEAEELRLDFDKLSWRKLKILASRNGVRVTKPTGEGKSITRREQLIEKLIVARLSGTLGECPACGHRTLKIDEEEGLIQCDGHFDSATNSFRECDYTSRKIERIPFEEDIEVIKEELRREKEEVRKKSEIEEKEKAENLIDAALRKKLTEQGKFLTRESIEKEWLLRWIFEALKPLKLAGFTNLLSVGAFIYKSLLSNADKGTGLPDLMGVVVDILKRYPRLQDAEKKIQKEENTPLVDVLKALSARARAHIDVGKKMKPENREAQSIKFTAAQIGAYERAAEAIARLDEIVPRQKGAGKALCYGKCVNGRKITKVMGVGQKAAEVIDAWIEIHALCSDADESELHLDEVWDAITAPPEKESKEPQPQKKISKKKTTSKGSKSAPSPLKKKIKRIENNLGKCGVKKRKKAGSNKKQIAQSSPSKSPTDERKKKKQKEKASPIFAKANDPNNAEHTISN